MQTTYRVKAKEIDVDLLESIKDMFNDEETVTITVQSDVQEDQYEVFLKSQELQKQYPPIRVSPDVDLSALTDEVNL